jgi:large subunit ribosomal protein L23
MRFPYYLRYLHEKPLPRNPLWNPGDPRHLIFMPLYWMKIVEPKHDLPKDFVKFECHWQMTANDVKQYLEKVYNVPVLDIRINIEKGEYVKHPKRPNIITPPMNDRKYAFVQLKEGEFKFPKVIEDQSKFEEKMEKEKKVFQNMQNKEKNKYLNRLDMGTWF